MNYRKKLIEVALPLDDINTASAREKSIRHGHPSTLHLWWARRPLAAARAVIFAQMVDDPSTYLDILRQDKKLVSKATRELNKRMKLWELAEKERGFAQAAGAATPEPGPKPELDEILAVMERERLFQIILELVLWENTTNEAVLEKARAEIWQSWRRACADNVDHPRAKELFDRHKLPAFHDPFAGGGSLPLEAQRLGLEAYASDLNPVAVLINKAMIEIPPKFVGMPPVNPEARSEMSNESWKGASGLAEDVRYYGKWMRDEAEKRIGHLYPKVKITEEMINDPHNPRSDLKQYLGRELTVIAWIWARTVKSPNPAYAHVAVPLASTFMLSTKKGKEAYVEPVIEGDSYRFTVKVGTPKDPEKTKRGTKLSRGANFECVISGAPIGDDYIKAESMAGRMGTKLMAIVTEGNRGRTYISPNKAQETMALQVSPEWKPDMPMNRDTQDLVSGRGYGFFTWADLFTYRQLLALTTFSDLIRELGEYIKIDAFAAGLSNEPNALEDGGFGCKAYAEAIAVYLSFGTSRLANRLSTICIWNRIGEKIEQVFARQAIPMTWDFVEANVFSESTGGWKGSLEWIPKVLELLPLNGVGHAWQDDATKQLTSIDKMVSTDPPYYDNINYADLSDFFYIWLRRTLRLVYSQMFSTLTVPKTEELVAATYRHGGRETAERFFLEGMTRAMQRLADQAHSAFPVTIYYAFKQSESNEVDGTASTGWETFLEAVILAGFKISGTWPIRTERDQGLKTGSNVLASSVVLVCRKRHAEAPTTTRRDFINSLKAELPLALAHLQRSNIAPVDLAQAAIGPGMAVYTLYESVLETDGSKVGVREALALINQMLDEVLAEQEGDFDADTRWALAWFEQFSFNEGEYGVAEMLSKAKNTSIDGLVEAGILFAKSGKVRLLKPAELPEGWDPLTEKRLTVWEIVHHLVRALEQGESAAAELIAKLGVLADSARELTYRLYMICERKKWAQEALAYNSLVQSWPEIVTLARELELEEQPRLF